jgi:hypothetical protein
MGKNFSVPCFSIKIEKYENFPENFPFPFFSKKFSILGTYGIPAEFRFRATDSVL